MKIFYNAILDPQVDGGFTVTFPDLPDAITEGDTEEEALFNASEVLTLTLDGRIDEGEDIPDPAYIGGVAIYPAPLCQSAILVRKSRQGRPLSDVARVLQTSWAAAQRLENPRHATNIRQLEKAASIFGKRLVLSFE
jgi:antitoxin HicB